MQNYFYGKKVFKYLNVYTFFLQGRLLDNQQQTFKYKTILHWQKSAEKVE